MSSDCVVVIDSEFNVMSSLRKRPYCVRDDDCSSPSPSPSSPNQTLDFPVRKRANTVSSSSTGQTSPFTKYTSPLFPSTLGVALSTPSSMRRHSPAHSYFPFPPLSDRLSLPPPTPINTSGTRVLPPVVSTRRKCQSLDFSMKRINITSLLNADEITTIYKSSVLLEPLSLEIVANLSSSDVLILPSSSSSSSDAKLLLLEQQRPLRPRRPLICTRSASISPGGVATFSSRRHKLEELRLSMRPNSNINNNVHIDNLDSLRIGSPSACSDPSGSSAVSGPSSVNSEAVVIEKCPPPPPPPPRRTSFGRLPSYDCHWTGCQFASTNMLHVLTDHVRSCHMTRRADDIPASSSTSPAPSKKISGPTAAQSRTRGSRLQFSYMCEWKNCKMFRKPSKSLEWLNRHVMSTHAGQKRHLQCIVEGCKSKFASRNGLERHVNSHFKNNETDCITRKYSKKKREGCSKPTYIDCLLNTTYAFTRDAVVTMLPATLTSTTSELVMRGLAIEFNGKVIGKRTCNGHRAYLVHWTPNDMIPDTWETKACVLPRRCIDIRAFTPEKLALKYPQVFALTFAPGKKVRKYLKPNR